MGVTVSVNDRTVIHRGSQGMALGMPDICKTPKSGEPVVYTNLAISADLQQAAVSVFSDSFAVAKQSSFIGQSYGDEPGTEGGVISGCNRGKASWITYSTNVLVEGERVPRALDLTVQNHGSPPNTLPSIFWQQVTARLDPMQIVCVTLCTCHALRQKMNCFHYVLASTTWAKPFYGGDSTRVYDPYFAGLYLEVTFGPEAVAGKRAQLWEVTHSTATSSRWKDANGKPLPLPAGEKVAGSKRPDVVVAKDPSKPLTRANVREIIEVKFPPDKLGSAQKEAYNNLVPGLKMRQASPESCGCEGVDKLLHPVPYRYPFSKNVKEPAPEVPPKELTPDLVTPVEPPPEPLPAPKSIMEQLDDWITPLIPGVLPLLLPKPSGSLTPAPGAFPFFILEWDPQLQRWVPAGGKTPPGGIS